MKLTHIILIIVVVLTVFTVQPAQAVAPDTVQITPTALPSPDSSGTGGSGPNLNQFADGINPLTGLPVSDPARLKLPAVLVSLSNFPPSARPQTGLSFAPQVYEIYITEGMTRFLTVFYGDLPQSEPAAGSTQSTPGSSAGNSGTVQPTPPAAIGAFENPGDGLEGVRSGREAYVPIVNAFPNGCLVAASKSAAVNVNICRNVYGSDSNDINSAGLTFDQMADLAEANANPNRPVNYSGNAFSSTIPAGGKPAGQLNVFYAWLNQSQWMYDEAAQSYLRYEDFGTAEKAGQFRPAVDRLTGEPVDFENVVILFVEHTARRPTIIDLEMGVGTQGKAIVFRNGQVYSNVRWSMLNEAYERTTGLARPLRLRNADGTPFMLAPGHTWYHVATTSSAVWALDAGAGIWKYRFYAPVGAKN